MKNLMIRLPHYPHPRFSARAHLDGKAPDVRPTPTIVSTMFARMVASAGETTKLHEKKAISTSHINPKSVAGTERQATVVRVYQDGEASTARNPLCHYHPHEHPLKTTVHYAKYVSPYLPNSHLRFDY